MGAAEALLNVTHSVRGQTWVLRCPDNARVEALTAQGYSQAVAQLLAGREVTPDQVAAYLNPSLREFLSDPSTLMDMDKAAIRILDAVDAGDNITVFADYDVDGSTSAAQLIRWGRAIGQDFGLYVPDRLLEGYGPNVAAMRKLKENAVDLVIAVDCGATACEALEEAARIDLPVIVIDHHLMQGEPPPAAAIVNPNRADDTSGLDHLAGAGVTFLLLVALNREARRRGRIDTPDIRRFLDLAALGTVCDVVPLTGLNRAYVAQGLKVLSSHPNTGLAALAKIAGISPPFSTYHCGFILGPRINAGGRLGQSDMGARLLSSDDGADVDELAQALDETNEKRKVLQDQILGEALEKAEQLPKENSILLVAMDDWHPGVIGIVAGRLKDRFNKPAIVIGVDEGIGKGSGRSIKGVNLGGAIGAAREKGLLISGGGHEMAAGLTMEKGRIDALSGFLEKTLADDVVKARAQANYKIDALLSAGAATSGLISRIESVGPYGAGNPQPVFVFANMRICYAERVSGGHVRCAFEDNMGMRLSGIAFRANEAGLDEVLLLPNPPFVHVAGRLKLDTWNDRPKINLQVSDLATL